MLPTTLRLGDVEIARLGLGTNRLTNTPPRPPTSILWRRWPSLIRPRQPQL